MTVSRDPASGEARAFIVGHASSMNRSIALMRAAYDVPNIDVVRYGRAPDGAELPIGASLVELPSLDSRFHDVKALLGLARRVVSRRYDVTAAAQPRLGMSRGRGALLAAAALAGRRRPLAIDPSRDLVSGVLPARLVLIDAARFLALHVSGTVVARVLAPVAHAAARCQAAHDPRPEPPRTGTVIYLRTDQDLASSPLSAGGSLAHTEGIIAALQRRGHSVELWSTGTLVGVSEGVAHRRLPAVVRPNVPLELAELLSGVRQAMSGASTANDVVLVYQRYSLNNLFGVFLARRLKVPFVLEVNASEVSWRAQWSRLQYPALAKATERLIMSSADRVASVSANARDELLDAGAEPRRTRVIPNGVDVDRFAGAQSRKLPIPQGAFVIMFVGLFYPWHGVRVLAEAFVLLAKELPAARLVLVGDGEEADVVRQVLASGDVLDRVHFTGLVPREQIPGYLAAADVLVSPHVKNDRFIGSPIKLWEYMASGRAIVGTRVAQIGTVLRDGESALVVEPDSPAAISAALQSLAADRGLRDHIGSTAQAEAREHHSWDVRLAQTLRDVG